MPRRAAPRDRTETLLDRKVDCEASRRLRTLLAVDSPRSFVGTADGVRAMRLSNRNLQIARTVGNGKLKLNP